MQSPTRVLWTEYVLQEDMHASWNLERRTPTIMSSHELTIKCHLTQPPTPLEEPPLFFSIPGTSNPLQTPAFLFLGGAAGSDIPGINNGKAGPEHVSRSGMVGATVPRWDNMDSG